MWVVRRQPIRRDRPSARGLRPVTRATRQRRPKGGSEGTGRAPARLSHAVRRRRASPEGHARAVTGHTTITGCGRLSANKSGNLYEIDKFPEREPRAAGQVDWARGARCGHSGAGKVLSLHPLAEATRCSRSRDQAPRGPPGGHVPSSSLCDRTCGGQTGLTGGTRSTRPGASKETSRWALRGHPHDTGTVI